MKQTDYLNQKIRIILFFNKNTSFYELRRRLSKNYKVDIGKNCLLNRLKKIYG